MWSVPNGTAYDPLNNLRIRNLNNASNLSYSYSYTGNNRLGSITGNGNKLFTLNNLGQITQIQGIASYHYDGNGRRIKTIKGSTTEIALNRLGWFMLVLPSSISPLNIHEKMPVRGLTDWHYSQEGFFVGVGGL